jgi:hypothetical protein
VNEPRSVRFVRYGERFLRLPRGQRRMTVEALGLVAGVGGAFALFPPATVASVLARMLAARPLRPPPPQLAAEVARCVRRAARHSPRANCLSQAVAGWLMLRRRSFGAELKLGARRAGARLGAHAWLSVDGEAVLGGEEAESHVPFG